MPLVRRGDELRAFEEAGAYASLHGLRVQEYLKGRDVT